MLKQKWRLAYELFIVGCFSIWLISVALSFPKLLAQNDRFQLFIRIIQLLLFPVLLYQITPRLRSRLFSGKETNSNQRKAEEAQQ